MLLACTHGFILALGLILPLGPQNIFVFNQGATARRFSGALPAILTAALSDTLLIFLAVAGVSLIILSFPWLQHVFMAAGFFFLIWIGLAIWRDTMEQEANGRQQSARQQVLFALSVSLLNPHAILDTIGVIGSNALHYSGIEKWGFAATCAAVSWLWFFGLALAGRWTGRLTRSGRGIWMINRVSACIIWAVALYIGVSLAKSFF